jgi:hypothetical protein
MLNDSTLTDTVKNVSSLSVSTKYYWRVCAKNSIGNSDFSDKWNFMISPTGIKIIGNKIPQDFMIYQNYPNPFNPATKIKFDLPAVRSEAGAMDVRLTIYDQLGREITTLLNEKLTPGTYEIEWDASKYPSGMYFYKLEAGNYSESKKLILLK